MSEKSEKITDEAGGEQNVDKIREILFGNQIRDYDKRFAELEQRLAADNEKLGQFIEKRLTGIATATQRELAGLAEQIEAQKQRLASSQEENRQTLGSLNHEISERINDLDEAVSREGRALRNDLGEQYNELAELIKTTREGLETRLGQSSDKLQHDKVARDDLAALLTELAGQLRQAGNGD